MTVTPFQRSGNPSTHSNCSGTPSRCAASASILGPRTAISTWPGGSMATRKAGEYKELASKKFGEYSDQANEFIQEKPLTSLAIAFGVGALLGMLMFAGRRD